MGGCIVSYKGGQRNSGWNSIVSGDVAKSVQWKERERKVKICKPKNRA